MGTIFLVALCAVKIGSVFLASGVASESEWNDAPETEWNSRPESEPEEPKETPVKGESDKLQVPSEANSEAAPVLAGSRSASLEGIIARRAQRMAAAMTLEEKVGQMFIGRCPAKGAAEKAAQFHLGGYILFGRDFSGKTKEEVITAIESYQQAAEIPMLIGVDEEGGSVNRISTNPHLRAQPFLSPQELYKAGGFELIRSDTQEKCRLLHSLGIHLNFAPVCDVSQNPQDFIHQRSFGQNARQTAEYAALVVQTMREEGMGSVLKHFPGYGDNADTHTGVSRDHRSYESFQTSDFLPFQAGIEGGADMVLVSHNIVDCMDSQCPASLSPQVHQILRQELGFSGVIITDDLSMAGVRKLAGDVEAAVLAVQAGNDMLCCTDFETQVPAVINAVKGGAISEEQIDESVVRILKCKLLLGVIQ